MENEQKWAFLSLELSRRKLVKMGVITGAGMLLTPTLRQGFAFDGEHNHQIYTFVVSPILPTSTRSSENVAAIEPNKPLEKVTTTGQIVIDNDFHLLEDPIVFKTGHRYGNSGYSWIKEAPNKGIRGIDTDVTSLTLPVLDSVGLSLLYAEHGISSLDIGKVEIPLPFVFDRDSFKFHIGPPKQSIERTIKDIAQVNKNIQNPQRHLIHILEEKRGPFTSSVRTKLYDLHHKYNVAAVIFRKGKPTNKAA